MVLLLPYWVKIKKPSKEESISNFSSLWPIYCSTSHAIPEFELLCGVIYTLDIEFEGLIKFYINQSYVKFFGWGGGVYKEIYTVFIFM